MTSPPDETPADLKGITEVLEKSLRPGQEEDIPPLPDDLRDRLKGQYGEQVAPARVAESPRESVWERLTSLFAQPAFVGSLAALVLVAVLTSLLMRSGESESGEVMRGGPDASATAQTIIILFDLEESQVASVKESGFFEEKHLYTTDSEEELSQWIELDGDSIIIDGAAGEIRHEDGRQVPLPSSGVSEAVLDLLGS